MLYIVTPSPHGGGYSLSEIGLLTLDIRDPQGLPLTAPITLPTPEPTVSTPAKTANIDPGEEIYDEPIPQVPPVPKVTPQPLVGQDTGFSFEKPKGQKELLRERGIQEPKKRLGPGKDLDAKNLHNPIVSGSVDKRKSPTSNSAKKRKSRELSDDDLPHVRSSSRTEITDIITATPEQAAAASQFGKH